MCKVLRRTKTGFGTEIEDLVYSRIFTASNEHIFFLGMKENFPLINERERENLRSSIETLNGEQMEILEQKMSYLK